MSITLQQLAFRSEGTSVADALGGLLEILDSAQRRKSKAGLTGAIAVSGARYFHVLEGDAEVIGETLGRIESDARHSQVQVVGRKPIGARSFRAWSLVSPAQMPSLKLQIDLAIAACEADCDFAVTVLSGLATRASKRERLAA